MSQMTRENSIQASLHKDLNGSLLWYISIKYDVSLRKLIKIPEVGSPPSAIAGELKYLSCSENLALHCNY